MDQRTVSRSSKSGMAWIPKHRLVGRGDAMRGRRLASFSMGMVTRRSAIVRIIDRGPFITGRVLDLSLAAAQAVDVWRAGVARVRIEVLETPAPIDNGGRWCVQIGAFQSADDAAELKARLEER